MAKTVQYVDQAKLVKATSSAYAHDIENAVNCNSCNIIYCITCLQCKAQYIGESEKSLATRFGQHKKRKRKEKIVYKFIQHWVQRHQQANLKLIYFSFWYSHCYNMCYICHFELSKVEKINFSKYITTN